ncbi:MAG: flagellar basal body rod protein FlgC [Armatimonadetes bacterium]|nr:flagellar basal body rod protein FlgC [Armatimonadota bacterium]
MNIGRAMRVSSSGMSAERFRMDVISGNIANANSVNKPGQPEIRRQSVVLQGTQNGVKILEIQQDKSPLRREYDPNNPAAVNGWVTYTNINPVFEMVDMVGASRAYEANLAAFNSAKSMYAAALNIGKAA